MAFVPVPNTCLAELRYLTSSGVAENTLYFERTSPYAEADLSVLANWLYNNFWLSNLQNYVASDVSLIGIRVTSLEGSTAPSFDSSFTSPSAGGYTGGSHVANVTFAIQFKTAQRGRSFRGRNYIVGIPALQGDNRGPNLTWATGVVGAYNQLFEASTDTGDDIVVVSRYSGGLPRVTGVTTPVTSFTFADLYYDSQRRRLPGRGS